MKPVVDSFQNLKILVELLNRLKLRTAEALLIREYFPRINLKYDEMSKTLNLYSWIEASYQFFYP